MLFIRLLLDQKKVHHSTGVIVAAMVKMVQINKDIMLNKCSFKQNMKYVTFK